MKAKTTANVRLRDDPSTSAGIVLTLPSGIVFDHALRVGEWVQVTAYIHGDYIQDMTPRIRLVPATYPIIKNRSQNSTGAWRRGNDCGEAAVAAMAEALGRYVEVDDLIYESDRSGTTSAVDLVNNGNSIGVKLLGRNYNFREQIPLPAIVLMNSRLLGRGYNYHWVIVKQWLPNGGVLIDDPDKGANLILPAAAFPKGDLNIVFAFAGHFQCVIVDPDYLKALGL